MALCFIAVLGIVLASYLAICSRTMTLSNRSFQAGLSQQLAEFGLEEGLRSFNKYDWSAWNSSPTNMTVGAWTLDTTNRRASRTITYASGKLGQGVTATVKIRIDNYDAAQLNSIYSSSASYRAGDLVGSGGGWFRSLRTQSAHTPYEASNASYVNMTWWAPGPLPSWLWNSATTYKTEDVVFQASTSRWYRYIYGTPSSNNPPAANPTYWTYTPFFTTFAAFASNNNETISYPLATTWYRWDTAAGGWQNAEISWRWRSGYPYVFNDMVFVYSTATSSYAWWRCITPHTSSGGTFAAGSNWENAQSGSFSWSSSVTYNQGDVVYVSGSWYRCLRANLNYTPPNSTYWSASPLYPTAWDAGRQYSQYDVVRYNGVWYRSKTTNSASAPAANTTDWASATDSSNAWSASTSYTAGAYVVYGGVWYKCSMANTGISPNNTTYWTPSWKNAWQPNTTDVMGAPVIYAEASISQSGNPPSRTQLRAVIHPAPLFPNAIAATETLTITGSGTAGTVDSYDGSAGYTYGQNTGPFATVANVGYSAVLAATSTTYPAVTIGQNTTVKGYVATLSTSSSPHLASFATNASMTNSDGSITTPHSTANSVDLTRISRSPYIPQFDVHPVNQHTIIPLSLPTTLNLGTPGAVTPSFYTYAADLTLGASNTININGPVILDVQGNLSTNTGTFVISSTGSLEVHVSGRVLIETGSGGFNNRSNDPKNLIIIATGNTGTSYYNATTYSLYGTIYMPNNSASNVLTIGSGVVIYGAISAKNITFNSEAKLHYDTSLRYAPLGGVDQPYAITDWRELPIAEQATMP